MAWVRLRCWIPNKYRIDTIRPLPPGSKMSQQRSTGSASGLWATTFRQPSSTDRVRVGAEPDCLRSRVIDHVAHRQPSALGDGCNAEKFLTGRIEADKSIRLRTGLNAPDAILIVRRHRVRERASTLRQRPLRELAASRIKAPEHASCVVAVPDAAICRDSHAPGTSPLVG